METQNFIKLMTFYKFNFKIFLWSPVFLWNAIFNKKRILIKILTFHKVTHWETFR